MLQNEKIVFIEYFSFKIYLGFEIIQKNKQFKMKNKFKYFLEFCIFSGPEFEILGPENDYFCVCFICPCVGHY